MSLLERPVHFSTKGGVPTDDSARPTGPDRLDRRGVDTEQPCTVSKMLLLEFAVLTPAAQLDRSSINGMLPLERAFIATVR